MNRLLPLALSVVIGLCGYVLPAPATAEEVQVTDFSKQAAASIVTTTEPVTETPTEPVTEATTVEETTAVETTKEETTQPETTKVETTKAVETTKKAETTKAPETTKKEKKTASMMWPADRDAIIAAGYPYYNSGGRHNGVDIALYDDGTNVSRNSPIYAAADGVVVTAYNDGNWNTGFGNYCIIDHGNGVQTLYAHSSNIKVSEGDTVKQGQVIGLIGDTGNTTAPHLHFEVRVESDGSYHRTNPLKFINEP